jgi:hypothetical protein
MPPAPRHTPSPGRWLPGGAGSAVRVPVRLNAVSDHIDGHDHSLSSPQPTERIAEALQPTVRLIQQLMSPRGACFIQDACRRIDPVARGMAAHIARHNSHLGVVPYPFHLPGVRERVNIECAMFLGTPHRSRNRYAGLPRGFQIQVVLVGELS